MRYKVTIILFLMIMLYGCEQANPSTWTPGTALNTFKIASKPELIESEISFNRKDIDGNILEKYSSLVGFENDNYYFSYGNDKYWIFSIGNEKSKDILPVFKIPKSNDIFFQGVYKNNFLIGMGYWEGDVTCHYELLLVSPDGEKKTVYKCVSKGYPTASLVDHYAIINLAEPKEKFYISKLFYIDLESGEQTIVETSEYTIVDNLYSGTFTINAGGWKDGFCYQKVVMNKESIQDDHSGKTSIYYYSFENKRSELLINYENKVYYISGSNNCFVTSDYLLRSRGKTGKIWVKEKDGYKSYDIPGIVAGEDIKNTYQLTDNIILIYNHGYYFIYDIQNKSFYKERYEFGSDDPNINTILSITANNDQFAYIEPDENSLILHIFKLDYTALK